MLASERFSSNLQDSKRKTRPQSAWETSRQPLTINNFAVTQRFIGTLEHYKNHPELKKYRMEALASERNPTGQLEDQSQNGSIYVPRCSGRIAQSNSVPRNCDDHGYIPTKNPESFYQTTNRRDFVGLPGSPAPTARPQSSRFYPKNTVTGKDIYTEEYGHKCVPKQERMRPGTASGQRKNNPHPLEAFLIWRFPGKIPNVDQLHDITDEAMHEVCKDKLKSTYQLDYTGTPQGVQHQAIYRGYPKTKRTIPVYTLDSTTRFDYQPPSMHLELKNNVSRYGCNARKDYPAVGAVPTVNETTPFLNVHGTTHYTTEFKDKSLQIPVNALVKPSVLPAMNEYMKQMKGEDQDVLVKLLKAIDLDKSTSKPLERLSDWPGPR